VVADTHAAVWYIVQPDRFSPAARAVFNQTATDGDSIYVSAISIVEVCYLVEKGKLSATVLQRLIDALTDIDSALVVFPVGFDVAIALQQIPRIAVPDMPDRIIAATALHLNLPLITRDRRIQAASISTIR
jgi:PIN domain nuclease of toxin-antitoxin system